jgi:hypothetical protein
VVAIDHDVCSVCGAPFLARLVDDSGRHRSGGGSSLVGLGRLPRPARLGIGIVLGVLLAILVPVLLALLG